MRRLTVTVLMLAALNAQGAPPQIIRWWDLAAATDADGETAYAPPSTNLYLHWAFASGLTNAAGKVVDSSGNGRTGTPGSGSARPTWASDYGGVALFEGDTDYIAFDYVPMSGFSNATILCWAIPDTTPQNMHFILGDGVSQGLFSYSGGGMKARKNGSGGDTTPTAPITDDAWVLYAATFSIPDGNVVKLYTNAVLRGTSSSGGTWTWGANSRMGNYYGQPTWDYAGGIGELMIYNMRFTAQMITNYFNGTKTTYGF